MKKRVSQQPYKCIYKCMMKKFMTYCSSGNINMTLFVINIYKGLLNSDYFSSIFRKERRVVFRKSHSSFTLPDKRLLRVFFFYLVMKDLFDPIFHLVTEVNREQSRHWSLFTPQERPGTKKNTQLKFSTIVNNWIIDHNLIDWFYLTAIFHPDLMSAQEDIEPW